MQHRTAGASQNGRLRTIAAVGVLVLATAALNATVSTRVALAQTTHWVDASVGAPSAPGTGCGANAGYATIAAALAAASNGDTINLCPGVFTEANLVVGANVRIQGQTGDPMDTAINAAAAGRVLSVIAGVEAQVRSISLTGGASTDGGAILNRGTLELNNVIVRANVSSGGGGGIMNAVGARLTVLDSLITANEAGTSGGAIFNDASSVARGILTIRGSTLSSNHAFVQGGAIFTVGEATVTDSELIANQAQTGAGSGIFQGPDATLTISNSTIGDNLPSQAGGGIFNSGTLSMSNSVVRGNESVTGGGGIRVATGGSLTMEDTTVTDNRAGTSGGGILNEGSSTLLRSAVFGNVAQVSGGGIFTERSLIIANSTVSRNRAVFGAGSGLFIGSEAAVVVINTTIAFNAPEPGRPAVFNNGTLTLANTIIADQLTAGGDCGGPGAFISEGHNLDSDASCFLTQPSDIPAGNANLGPLQDNGGATLTHALLAGSMAIDAGNNAVCAAAPIGGVDQRGRPRPGANATTCDIGAFEVQQDAPPPTPTPVPVTSTPTPTATVVTPVPGTAPPAATGITPPSTGDGNLSSER